MITTLHDTDHGVWTVGTFASVYTVDLDERTILRQPVAADASLLREDAVAIPLVGIARCEVGLGAVFVISGVTDDGLETTRTTTGVISIEVAP